MSSTQTTVTRGNRLSVARLNPLMALKLGLLGLIRAYQWTVGPALPRSCRFEPSCSRYAYTAIDRYGPLRGSWLTVKRLARCQPWGGSGYDPVP